MIKRLVREGVPSLAYVKTVGDKYPGVIFCGGYASTMDGTKAKTLEEICKRKGHTFIRYDKTGFGESVDATQKVELSFSQWKEDLFTVIEQLTEGHQILVGSSTGAWLGTLAAEKYPERIVGMLLVAPAFDFIANSCDRLSTPEIKKRIESGETVMSEGPFGEFPINARIVNESRAHHIFEENRAIKVRCPIRIYYGMQDEVASLTADRYGTRFAERVESRDVEVRLRKDSHHRLSTPQDVAIMEEYLCSLLLQSTPSSPL